MICKQFFKNVLPSMIAFAFTGIYAVVDGFFVGRSVGDVGLAAINMAFPLVALILAAGCGLGMAGAIQIAICTGKGSREEERRNLGNCLLLLVAAGVILTLALLLLYIPALRLFGADGELLSHAGRYIKIIIVGALPQVLAAGLVPIIRNYQGAFEAMLSMVAGFVTNIILDWLFVSVCGYGVSGAAAATVIGQMVTVVPCILYLIVKVHVFQYGIFRLRKSTVKYLVSIGISPFGLSLTPNIVVMIMNKGAVAYGDGLAVSCYAVVSYIICVIQLLIQGIGDGAQPLIGRYYGSGQEDKVKKVRMMSYGFGGLITIAGAAVLYLFRRDIAGIFGVSKEVENMFCVVVAYFLAGLLFEAFLRITISYFYAVEHHKLASALIYGEPVMLALLAAFVLPRFMGLAGVWMSVPATQISLAIIAGFLLKKSRQTTVGQDKIDIKDKRYNKIEKG